MPHHNYRVNTEPKHIPVISTTSVDTKITQKHRSRNLNNLIEIPLETPARTANIRSKFAYLPAFLLSNVMSLAPKIDEVRDVIYRGNYDFVSFVDIQGYNLIRRDRCERQHGGVCIYIKDTIEFSVLDELFDSLFEVLWINMRPTRLPRGFTNLIVGTVYHPPSAENAAMLNYLSNCLSVMESRFPNCGFIILGDFNKHNTSRLRTGYDLKQLVNFPTRGNNTLDIVLTNLNAFFDQPTKCAPFGLSDHMSIEVRPV